MHVIKSWHRLQAHIIRRSRISFNSVMPSSLNAQLTQPAPSTVRRYTGTYQSLQLLELLHNVSLPAALPVYDPQVRTTYREPVGRWRLVDETGKCSWVLVLGVTHAPLVRFFALTRDDSPLNRQTRVVPTTILESTVPSLIENVLVPQGPQYVR
jgi:hypothetical protein